MSKIIEVLPGQTIFDIALQEYGHFDGDELLIKDNPSLTLDSDLNPGQLLKITSPPIDTNIVKYFKHMPVVGELP